MHATGEISPQFQSSLKNLAQYLVALNNLPSFSSVAKAEEEAHQRLATGFEDMDMKEMQIVTMMHQITEIYARDRQLQITGRNPYETIIEMDEAEMKNGYSF
jgi:predicted transcriptional regulator